VPKSVAKQSELPFSSVEELSKLQFNCLIIFTSKLFERWRKYYTLFFLINKTSSFSGSTFETDQFVPLSDHNLSLDDHLYEARFGTQHLQPWLSQMVPSYDPKTQYHRTSHFQTLRCQT
jgi:hypothetical protein